MSATTSLRSIPHAGVGIGQLLLRISQFNEFQQRRPRDNQMHFWRTFVAEFFSTRAAYKYIVWLTEHEPPSFQLFQLTTETLPRFYNVIYSSSIDSVFYMLENPREYCLDSRTYLLFSKTRVEYKYENGCRVITKGYLRVTFSDDLKIILWEFEAKCHDEYLPTSFFKKVKRVRTNNTTHEKESNGHKETPPINGEISLDSLPKSQVNQFGLPPPVMRCFEITEVINYMKDLIDFAMERQLSPLASLEKYHQEVTVPDLHHVGISRANLHSSNQPPQVETDHHRGGPGWLINRSRMSKSNYNIHSDRGYPMSHLSQEEQQYISRSMNKQLDSGPTDDRQQQGDDKQDSKEKEDSDDKAELRQVKEEVKVEVKQEKMDENDSQVKEDKPLIEKEKQDIQNEKQSENSEKQSEKDDDDDRMEDDDIEDKDTQEKEKSEDRSKLTTRKRGRKPRAATTNNRSKRKKPK